MNIRIIERRLRADYQLPEDFKFFRWECFPKRTQQIIYVEFEGGVCPVLKSGKNKGQPNYKAATDRREFQVTIEKATEWEFDYYKDTGLCPTCLGEGKTVARFGVNIEAEYRECSRCKGTGKGSSAEFSADAKR